MSVLFHRSLTRVRKGNKVTTQSWAWLCGESWTGDTVNLNGVDLILDKISREGFQSLTEAEREVLQKASGKKTSDS